MKKYKIIYVDPPWDFKNKNTGGSMTSGASAKYNIMTLTQLKQLNINAIADTNSVLFMWWVGSQPQEAIDLVKAWGFKIKTMTGFNWIKRTKFGKLFFGMGFWTRAGSECCLIATKGKISPLSHGVRSVVEATVEAHSTKPDIFRKKIVELCGDIPRIELFARKKTLGWDALGLDIDGKDIKKTLKG